MLFEEKLSNATDLGYGNLPGREDFKKSKSIESQKHQK